ncbi:CDP-diacylglycerol--glycerol-3-phosphate 3-phosphatidyltransferase [Paenibacillus pasadenensis]|uniref:CDP-diacylglycerol--glycerol-3-phosphate 3-phosphatidyltransferase n=1 Tax=Paenibacillus pasadenensis TaxID=217090 RepID=UPI000406E37D|nr:CDP-diacylglycerol--glycerol-3-phosphate 3-phosphatidyltransferase [Paenibacillus pasadenensis]
MAESFGIFDHLHQHGLHWAVAIFVIASATDKLDGYIARKYNLVTNFGKLLDPLADKLLVSAALIMMVQRDLIPSWIAIVIIGREMLVSGIRIVAAAKGTALSADKLGKLKLVLQVAAITAVLLGNMPFSFFTDYPIDYALMIAAVLWTSYSGYAYLQGNYRKLELHA